MATSPQVGQGKGRKKPGSSQVPHPYTQEEAPLTPQSSSDYI